VFFLLASTSTVARTAAAQEGDDPKARGNQAMMDLNYEEALASYRAALAKNPSDVALHYTHVFLGVGTKVKRYTVAGDLVSDVADIERGTITHVFVDDACVYYWSDDGAGSASLRSTQKAVD
jgi:hypothetical protein